jgi:hypothetical protein
MGHAKRHLHVEAKSLKAAPNICAGTPCGRIPKASCCNSDKIPYGGTTGVLLMIRVSILCSMIFPESTSN